MEALRAAVDVPVETFDERFTTDAGRAGGGNGASASAADARAAAHLLTGYLEWRRR